MGTGEQKQQKLLECIYIHNLKAKMKEKINFSTQEIAF